MKPETQLINHFSVDLLAALAVRELSGIFHHTRIESNLTSQGIPDLNTCLAGHEFWIEFKVWPNNLEPLQHSWIKRRRDAGGMVFVVTKVGDNYKAEYKEENGSYWSNSIVTIVDFIINTVLANK